MFGFFAYIISGRLSYNIWLSEPSKQSEEWLNLLSIALLLARTRSARAHLMNGTSSI